MSDYNKVSTTQNHKQNQKQLGVIVDTHHHCLTLPACAFWWVMGYDAQECLFIMTIYIRNSIEGCLWKDAPKVTRHFHSLKNC